MLKTNKLITELQAIGVLPEWAAEELASPNLSAEDKIKLLDTLRKKGIYVQQFTVVDSDNPHEIYVNAQVVYRPLHNQIGTVMFIDDRLRLNQVLDSTLVAALGLARHLFAPEPEEDADAVEEVSDTDLLKSKIDSLEDRIKKLEELVKPKPTLTLIGDLKV